MLFRLSGCVRQCHPRSSKTFRAGCWRRKSAVLLLVVALPYVLLLRGDDVARIASRHDATTTKKRLPPQCVRREYRRRFEHQRAHIHHIASRRGAARRSTCLPTKCCYITLVASITAVVEVPVSMPLSRGRHLLHSSRSSIAPRGRRARRAPLLAQTHFLVCCAFNAMCDATFYVVAKFHVISAIVR